MYICESVCACVHLFVCGLRLCVCAYVRVHVYGHECSILQLSAVPDENCVDLSDHVVTDDTGKYRLSGLVVSC